MVPKSLFLVVLKTYIFDFSKSFLWELKFIKKNNFVLKKYNYIFFLFVSQYVIEFKKVVPFFEIGPYFDWNLIPEVFFFFGKNVIKIGA